MTQVGQAVMKMPPKLIGLFARTPDCMAQSGKLKISCRKETLHNTQCQPSAIEHLVLVREYIDTQNISFTLLLYRLQADLSVLPGQRANCRVQKAFAGCLLRASNAPRPWH